MADRPSTSLPLHPRPSTLDREAFMARFGDLYERSPWIAAAAWDQGLGPEDDSVDGLARRLAAVLDAAGEEQQLAVIRAHPDLAGKAALAGELTDDSRKEQAGAGLDQCTPEELARFTRLNAAYQARFAFPFVIAVKGQDRHAILSAFEARLDNTPDEERRTAIAQIHRIARLRLETRAAEQGAQSLPGE
ncbi:2-oxo-4-hydroxy-4-carboxy-5-ureidoimidazoline decarboxylase [Halomonas sp. YLGW01]|uniref:2-oxo-4-hydroxy-4-carboxy-5-ureidoimidazoline decarboxylase n=1 Tax=Halomonas sp. YLGW01 TaxID=2773308 RepID=UPI00177E45F3|nr:2-oxo-4-hydroxy-4-carboxy-5-ureidoimidazoline decarboxylase [Halomonas sp. YLGW01]